MGAVFWENLDSSISDHPDSFSALTLIAKGISKNFLNQKTTTKTKYGKITTIWEQHDRFHVYISGVLRSQPIFRFW